MRSSIDDLVGTIAKLAPNLGMVSTLAKSITEVIVELDDYRPGSRGVDEGDTSGFGMYQSKMMSSTKEIARTAQAEGTSSMCAAQTAPRLFPRIRPSASL